MRGYWHNKGHGEPRGYGYQEYDEEFTPEGFYGRGPGWGFGPGPQGEGFDPRMGRGFGPRFGRGFGPWGGRGFGPQFGFGRGPWGGPWGGRQGRHGWHGGFGPWGWHGFGWGEPSLDMVIEGLEHVQGHLERRLERVKQKLDELRTERAHRQESAPKAESQPAQPQPGFTETNETDSTSL
jgi:hypothetical protein